MSHTIGSTLRLQRATTLLVQAGAEATSAISALSIVLLGFSLGMRHATDPDHVVAVAAIVSRERSLRGAALIGSLWGVGHTLAILLAGGAIILFGIVVPARVGLTMELSVAMMLILLGGLRVGAAAVRLEHAGEHRLRQRGAAILHRAMVKTSSK